MANSEFSKETQAGKLCLVLKVKRTAELDDRIDYSDYQQTSFPSTIRGAIDAARRLRDERDSQEH